ncbi:MAG: hypothetical protein AAFX79_00305 [Planctomycetota bacterium]
MREGIGRDVRCRGFVKIACLVCVVLGLGILALATKTVVGAVQAHAAEVQAVDGLSVVVDPLIAEDALTEAITDEPALLGRIVLADRETGVVEHDLWSQLPDELRTVNPDEVRTAVLYRRWQMSVGTAGGGDGMDGGTAFRIAYDVVIVRVDTRTIIARHTIVGDEPAMHAGFNADVWGPDPWADMIAWIDGLPRR